mmetsp:Transcript_34885/g.79559  ORF Transcript_34885/g.79559 Transcript_34885/m.79559 type:complete len:383 (-) Transcript_34885:56-1204(-)
MNQVDILMTPRVADVIEAPIAEEQSGSLGVILVEAEDGPFHGRVVVLTLVEGGPAELDGHICAGDMIVRVDDQDVQSWDVQEIRMLVHGPANTMCKLEFERPSMGRRYTVVLQRMSKKALEKHEGQLVEEIKAAQVLLFKEELLHDAAEVRVRTDDKLLENLREAVLEAQKEKIVLQGKQMQEEAEEQSAHDDVRARLATLRARLAAVRTDAATAHEQRLSAEREVERLWEEQERLDIELEAERAAERARHRQQLIDSKRHHKKQPVSAPAVDNVQSSPRRHPHPPTCRPSASTIVVSRIRLHDVHPSQGEVSEDHGRNQVSVSRSSLMQEDSKLHETLESRAHFRRQSARRLVVKDSCTSDHRVGAHPRMAAEYLDTPPAC